MVLSMGNLSIEFGALIPIFFYIECGERQPLILRIPFSRTVGLISRLDLMAFMPAEVSALQ